MHIQEADRAEEFPGERGRVEVEKGENDKEQRGVRRERKREATEENEEGEKEGKEAEDGDKVTGKQGGKREERMIEGKRRKRKRGD